jgi:8'-apo-carotenoid 13,14-cleaving dioxygenase
MPCCANHWCFPDNDPPVSDETNITDRPVSGTLPAALSGRYLCIGPNPIGTRAASAEWASGEGMVHAVTLHPGGAVSYRNRWILTDAAAQILGIEPVPGPRHTGPDVVASNVITFGSTILALGDGALAYELTADLSTRRRVDLAGSGRGLHPHATVDPLTGELHLLAAASDGTHTFTTVSPGALTRTTRCIVDAPGRLRDLAVTRHHVVLVADGSLGVADRTGAHEMAVNWVAIGPGGRRIAAAHSDAGRVVVLTTGPALERWTLHHREPTVRHHVLDATPQTLPASNERLPAGRRYLWTIAAGCAHRHDLVTGTRHTHDFGSDRQPGQLVFVTDPQRAGSEDGGWLVGVVHDHTHSTTQFVVLDAQATNCPAVATVHIPRRIPKGVHATWIPSTR